MSIIVFILVIAAILVAYIQGDGNGYKRGRNEVLKEMRNIHTNVDVYGIMREAGSRASSKQASPQKGLKKW